MRIRFTMTGSRRYYVIDSTNTWTEVDARIASNLVKRGYVLELT